MVDDHLQGDWRPALGCSRVDEGRQSAPSSLTGLVPGAVAFSSPADARVVILLCTCNGQAYLAEQLDSIARQSWPAWTVALCDDGSQDQTLDIAARYQAQWGADKLSIWYGPRQGFAANFLAATRNQNLAAEYYAWCDQDDIWHEDKLLNAVSWLQSVPAEVPALYMGRTALISEAGQPMGHSPRCYRPPSFANALVQNISAGNTMLFNQATRTLLCEADEHLQRWSLPVVSHDWWAYLLVSGVGGRMLYDPQPYVHDRQPASNLTGPHTAWLTRWSQLRMIYSGRLRLWNSTNIAALNAVKLSLTQDNRALLAQFGLWRDQHLAARLIGFRRSGLYRQTKVGNLGLWLAAVIKAL